MMTFGEMQRVLARIRLPAFVEAVRISERSFNTRVGRGYCVFVQIGKAEAHPDVYRRRGASRSALTNNPFDFPADEDEFRRHIVAAILMGVAHETIEQVSDGGQVMCAPHRYVGGTKRDTEQWLFLLDALRSVIDDYSERMAVVVG